MLSVLLLGESMSAMNIVGMVVTVGGIVLYNVIKFRQTFGEANEKRYAIRGPVFDDCFLKHCLVQISNQLLCLRRFGGGVSGSFFFHYLGVAHSMDFLYGQSARRN